MASSPIASEQTNSRGLPTVHLLIMGLTGSGKSTFIQKATGDNSIETGEGLESVTTEVRGYPMVYNGYEVFLIDTPGFDDDKMCDDDVLKMIADFVNTICSTGWTFGGIIYLHDIGRTRMGNAGTLNIRVLESFTGKENFKNITLVTNKWGLLVDPEVGLLRERQLQEHPSYWAEMRQAGCQARMCRFDNTEASALKIIDWHLEKSFVPRLSQQMVTDRATLGRTDAGQVIREKYEAIFARNGWSDQLARMNDKMESSFQGAQTQVAIAKLLKDLERLKKKQMLQRAGAWVVRLATYGGAVVATVLTENPAAFRAAIAAAGPLEMSFRSMKSRTQGQMEDLRQSIATTALYGPLNNGAGQMAEVGDE
ncbi:uncharacterized protein Z520_07366 [Fonsecaea multimorphosa CBS 102226]|uniref:AIG1-type G domain-containing protein n=1 Tax=Fonsecaea multimorphosa CBS 102226 TaxID=1442371 RepID=A0A0D2JT44_9EURO|nr:uncharacterized protein Z520_07366 [Fonsecaea multimorphosa CBS 102226]KIX96647.1 hypothetical protein Z520_07366 [Fonsecaea multimorphosa CBS 102226]OAL20729.1 hypothetical protein AYO22_08738 [Fonsecaea multimorphosa]